MRILVTGYHRYARRNIVHGMLAAFAEDAATEDEVTVIDGGANGLDAIAREWPTGEFRPVGHETHSYLDYPEDPDDYRVQYQAVNEAMVASGADVCLAFKDTMDFTLETGMTEHCVSLAKAAGIPVYLITKV